MTEFTLLQAEISSLKRAHRAAKKKRDADRIKAIILLGTGWAIIEVAEVLLLDDETIRNYMKRYKSGKLNALLNDNYKGYSGKLLKPEIEQLDSHLNETTYLRTQGIVSYVARHLK
jgi:transposase